jgi:hypothetical protein
MAQLAGLIDQFVDSIRSDPSHIYNEFSLQHELAIFLRAKLPNYLVQFERNVSFFFPVPRSFIKREIDISIYSPNTRELLYAVELKYPRNGQHPEQMFSFCKDIVFAEQLQAEGFGSTALIVFADDPLFYQGSASGIYRFFRGTQPLHGRVQKPTGSKDEEVEIRGRYVVEWRPICDSLKFAVIEVVGFAAPAPSKSATHNS